MRVLVATPSIEDRPGDFNHAVPGEVVVSPVIVCGRDQDDPDGPDACGCGREWVGLGSHKGTTTAVVADVEMTPGQLREAIEALLLGSGLPLSEAFVRRDARVQASELRRFGRRWPLGSVVRRRLDRVGVDL